MSAVARFVDGRTAGNERSRSARCQARAMAELLDTMATTPRNFWVAACERRGNPKGVEGYETCNVCHRFHSPFR